MARQALAICIVALAAAALAGSAAADKPDRGPAPSGPLDFPAGLVCPFAVSGVPTENRQHVTVFAGGKVQFNGFFAAQLTNVANGKSITLNANGAVRLTQDGDNQLIESTGPIIWFLFPGDAGPGDVTTGRTILTKGHTEVVADPATLAFHSFETDGNVTDLCAALA
jgi:hypothetical protein